RAPCGFHANGWASTAPSFARRRCGQRGRSRMPATPSDGLRGIPSPPPPFRKAGLHSLVCRQARGMRELREKFPGKEGGMEEGEGPQRSLRLVSTQTPRGGGEKEKTGTDKEVRPSPRPLPVRDHCARSIRSWKTYARLSGESKK
ncbi:hypothetical protein THAOC_25396, partial [Thalassiosira oceanica]